jgi:hypothetical protein
MQMENLIAKIRGELEMERRQNKVYKQSVQIGKMEARYNRKKKLFEDKKKVWQEEMEKLKELLDAKYKIMFPDEDVQVEDEEPNFSTPPVLSSSGGAGGPSNIQSESKLGSNQGASKTREQSGVFKDIPGRSGSSAARFTNNQGRPLSPNSRSVHFNQE